MLSQKRNKSKVSKQFATDFRKNDWDEVQTFKQKGHPALITNLNKD